jgi:hypothetical protein
MRSRAVRDAWSWARVPLSWYAARLLPVTHVAALQPLSTADGVQGMAAAKLGGFVCLTDRADKPEVLENCRLTCALNGVTSHTKTVSAHTVSCCVASCDDV